MDFLQITGKTILVVGVANRKSVAWHIAQLLTQAGATVVYVVRTAERRDQVQKLAEGAPVFVCDVDGGNLKQVTRNGAANFCPFFHPSGKKLIYASNQLDRRGSNFDLFLVDLDSGAEERITEPCRQQFRMSAVGSFSR